MNTKADQPDGEPLSGPVLSPEFLSGGTEAGLEKIRTRLLDLTNRNRLLNFRHSIASSLRIVDADIDVVFRRLLDNEKLALVQVPEPDLVSIPKISATERANELGWRTSYDLDEPSENNLDSRTLPVLHYFPGLEALSRKIGSAAKTAIEESGTNMLFLILGFLEWYEADDSQQPRIAPLLTIPVTLDRGAGKTKGVGSTVEYSGEDLATNLSLVEKMRRDFGLEIPSVDYEDTPEKYFARFSHIMKRQKRWRIRHQVTLTLLSFGKLLMYRDLDPRIWPAITKHKLVKEFFEGTKSETIAHAEEFSIDAADLKSELPPVILDADSSQHSALIDALRGHNLVIEGPPGTGKSQTITNLIAAALVKGKTILFMAEKLAALEVVRRRLDEAGLGFFCLELHSNKTRKHELLNDLATRIGAHRSFQEPRELEQHSALVEDKKQQLTRYVELMNQLIGPFQATVFEILWARDRFHGELPFARELSGLVPDALSFTRKQYSQKEQFLSVYEQHLRGALRACPALEEHPWAWVKNPLSFVEEERVIDLLGGLIKTIADTTQQCENLRAVVNISLGESIEGINVARHLLGTLPGRDETLAADLLAHFRDSQVRTMFHQFSREVTEALNRLRYLNDSTPDPQLFLQDAFREAIGRAFDVVRAQQLEQLTCSRFLELFQTRVAFERALTECERSFAALRDLLGVRVHFNSQSIKPLLDCLRLMESAPLQVLHLRAVQLESDGVGQTIRNAAIEARCLREMREELSRKLDLSLASGAMDPMELAQHASSLEQAGFLSVLFGRAYRNARRIYRRIARGGRDSSRHTMARDLRSLSDYFQRRRKFEDNISYRAALGSNFAGVDSDWDGMCLLASWYEEVFIKLPEHDEHSAVFRELLLRSRTEHFKGLRDRGVSLEASRASLENLETRISQMIETQTFLLQIPHSLLELREQLQVGNRLLGGAAQVLGRALNGDIAIAKIPVLLNAAENHLSSLDRISASHTVRELLADHFDGINTDLGAIEETLSFAERFTKDDSLLRKASEWILCRDYVAHLDQLRGWLSEIADGADGILKIGAEIDAITGSAWWPAERRDSLEALRTKAETACGNRDELPRWVHFVRVRGESLEKGLSKLTSLADSKAIEPEHLVPAFRYLFYNSFARGLFAENPELAQFSGTTQEQVRQQFASSDKIAIELYRQLAASIIDRRSVPFGNQSGPVGTWTDSALILHEINKQKRHIPIRQLVRRATNALQALKPCFMMGPLSVAQYLTPGEIQFDLIIMDEASQLKPEDAIGTIARGAQVVIVGDPKQLPPTNFFQRVAIDSDEEGGEDSQAAVEEGESILDVASTLYQPVRRLRWHYRSRHHSLIAFSNREFYQGDLIIFPSAYHEHADLGIKYHPVPGAIFENRRNAVEAETVVEAVLEHMEKRPEESLGVVALNFEQRELIEELLDARLRADPFAMVYQERMNAGPEPFFVKNLENVQGDERDVIFISVTYGPDARGNQYLRFGPINGADGHRRLNVLFTRAKKRTEIFSSLDPDKIQTGGGSWGLRALKGYLTFARSGVMESPDDGGEQPTNDFERSVGSVLKESGYHVVPQVGVAGFFIDLAVRHPFKPGVFVLGVECDGASYRSGRSARDRDRLRQEILINLGWEIHRVWSTDWFKSRPTEIRRLLRRLEDILAADPDYLREMNKAQRVNSLRKQLNNLRDSELRASFPDSPAEKGLLRDDLLEELVRKRPTTMGDWFRVISHELRSNTEPKQIGQFLQRVLSILGDAPE